MHLVTLLDAFIFFLKWTDVSCGTSRGKAVGEIYDGISYQTLFHAFFSLSLGAVYMVVFSILDVS